ncbi:hypothetical protein FRB98_004156 [Tulasnella sp. 332]|nr:hypothetical protein FRB98_004156 [Tulasnella sp. 332]
MASKPMLPTQTSNTSIPQDAKARGAYRTTKGAHKLKVLPEQPEEPDLEPGTAPEDERGEGSGSGNDELELDEDEEDAPVYKQISHIPAGTARRDALRLTKKQKAKLPRVTAYCTANSYKLSDLMRFFMARKEAYLTAPKQFDEVIYTPYSYESSSTLSPRKTLKSLIRPQASNKRSISVREGDLLGIPELREEEERAEAEDTATARYDDDYPGIHNGSLTRPLDKQGKARFGTVTEEEVATSPEVFLFEYGTVVIWGMTEAQEKRFLNSLRRFEVEKLPSYEVELEDLNFYYANYSRTKLALSHALAQSVKISLFEELISNTIDQTKDIPEVISETGKIGMPHKEIMQQIGRLFILRMNINLVGSVLDAPEIFWSFPDLQPLYDAARSYLEIPQRVDLLNARVEVLQDLLGLLKESVSSRHAERLEQIVIALIGVEIILGIITIAIDLFSSWR